MSKGRKRRKRKGLLPETLSQRECERRGWKWAHGEYRFPGSFIRKDAFGLADLLAIGPEIQGTLYIQATSRSNHAARRKKAKENENLEILLRQGNQFEIWSWICEPRDEEDLKVEVITLEDLHGS